MNEAMKQNAVNLIGINDDNVDDSLESSSIDAVERTNVRNVFAAPFPSRSSVERIIQFQ